uniref:Acetyl-coenzyme A synthetase, cytoplasmic n=1 Tax=Scleropages formosus TaxID=113540 RepID=A0A8C9SRX5_SCLFO
MVVPGSRERAEEVFQPPEDLLKDAHVPDFNTYLRLYKKSTEEPEVFWTEVAEDFFWKNPPKGQILQYNFDITKGSIYVSFMEGAKTNVCYNVLDRNILDKNLGEKVAFYWEGNSPDHQLTITYNTLLVQVCKCANVLREMGVKKGDTVAIYLPMIPELVYTMLACARIGAVHSVVFAGFSSESLCERVLDAQCSLLVTADGVYRGEKLINLKRIADEALDRSPLSHTPLCAPATCFARRPPPIKQRCPNAPAALIGPRPLPSRTPWDDQLDVWWDDLMESASELCEPEWVDAEDPLFILYTSGSTGKPKGVLHTTAGYLLYAALTFKYVFDHRHDDVYWCTADVGWITGHSYITYGPLANGATGVFFEGVPVYPHVGRYWEIIEKYRVTKFYTAPTAIRLLMKYGKEPVLRYDLGSLRILGTVGEPINPEAWHWYRDVVGQTRCPVVDTFWQTETRWHGRTGLPGIAAYGFSRMFRHYLQTLPFFGVQPAILNEDGEELEGEAEGYLVFRQPWPGIMRTVYGNQERFENTYFKKFPGFYVTGDGKFHWRHLLSTAEVESALSDHPAVAEAAVVSRPHAVKGECLYCFVTLKEGGEFSRTLTEELRRQVREKIGPIATPDFIQNAPGLPKTRSGKIMRRILRHIARNDKELGDLSTLADPKVVEALLSQRCEAAA